MNLLEQILVAKRAEVTAQKRAVPQAQLTQMPHFTRTCHSLQAALQHSSSGIIAEFKRKSPSKGFINQNAQIAEIIPSYVINGAAAISILTDNSFFGGSSKDLLEARPLANIPLLRKEFIVDEYQLFEAKALGADAILLIAAALSIETCKAFAQTAKSLGLSVLLEIKEEQELPYINDQIDVVGVNNRDLRTFVTDINSSIRLSSLIPATYTKISESGIATPKDVKLLQTAGYNGFLIGETFMRLPDAGKGLRDFIAEM